jgi:hypothetical protein
VTPVMRGVLLTVTVAASNAAVPWIFTSRLMAHSALSSCSHCGNFKLAGRPGRSHADSGGAAAHECSESAFVRLGVASTGPLKPARHLWMNWVEWVPYRVPRLVIVLPQYGKY